MTQIKLGRVLLLSFVFLIIAEIFTIPNARAVEKKPLNHVILISVGGFNYEGYISTASPNLRNLITEGVVSEKTIAVRSDTLEAAEASLLTGATPDQHKHLTVKDRVEVESLLDIMKKKGKSILVVDGSGGKLGAFAYGEKEYRKTSNQASNKEIFDQALSRFKQGPPFFSYLYFDGISDSLLRYDQKAYYSAVKDFDNQLGVFIKKIRDEGWFGTSLIIVSSARGTSPSNLNPVVMCGPGVKVNARLQDCLIIDIAPTICRLAGLEAPSGARGVPIYGAIGVNEQEQSYLMSCWVKDLRKDRIANWNINYQLQEELYRTIGQINSIKEEKQSVFDFAGEREKMIADLKSRLKAERSIWGAITLLLLAGYVVEFLWLRRKYLLFK